MPAVEALGYQPDMLAQSLRKRETKTVGFVIGDIANPLLAEIASGAEAALRGAGYSLLLTNSENEPALDARHIALLEQRRVDGLLLSLAAEDDPATVDLLSRTASPIVLVDRELPPSVRASAVLSDHRSGIAAAVDHLLDLGHRDIGLILGQPLRFSRERQAGLEEAYARRGLPPTYAIVDGRLASGHGRHGSRLDATRRLLNGPNPRTAIIAGGNQLLMGTMEVLREEGLRVGRDISLVSCDAVPITELYDPPIAVVRRDNIEIGRRAAQLLLDLLEREGEPRQDILPTEFLPRPSCAPPRR